MIFLDTNVVSEDLRTGPNPAVLEWLVRNDRDIALSTVVVGEVWFGIYKIRPDERSKRLAMGLDRWQRRFSGRIFPFNEAACRVYGELMGEAARKGRGMEPLDGMIAAIAKVNLGKLATRNIRHFETTGLELIDPWKH